VFHYHVDVAKSNADFGFNEVHMTQIVRVNNGSYRGQRVHGKVFQLVKPYQVGAKGGYVTVSDTAETVFRIRVRNERDVVAVEEQVAIDSLQEYRDTATPAEPSVPSMLPTSNDIEYVQPEDNKSETDQQIMDRVAERFTLLNEMTMAAKEGSIRAMIVSGAPGVGKSYGVERTLEDASVFDKLSRVVRHEVVKGSTSAIGLYVKLFNYSGPSNVVVFDDCDDILQDETSLNILKSALDSNDRRFINWSSNSHFLRREGIPNRFEFKGSVIFISNLKFDNFRGKLKNHLDALMSRCHYLDLTIHTRREKLLRIRQIANSGFLFNPEKYDFTQEQRDAIVDFVIDNANRMREISLRSTLKIADLVKMNPDDWQRRARILALK